MRAQDIWPTFDDPSFRSFSYGRKEAEQIIRHSFGRVLVFVESLGGLGDDSYLMALIAAPDKKIGFMWVRYREMGEGLGRAEAAWLVDQMNDRVAWAVPGDAVGLLSKFTHSFRTRELATLYDNFKPLAFAALEDMREHPSMIRRGRKRVMPS